MPARHFICLILLIAAMLLMILSPVLFAAVIGIAKPATQS